MNALNQPGPAARPGVELVLDAAGVAALIGLPSEDAFYRRRVELEAAGFPARLPGLPRWSRPCILRWIETNGVTHLPGVAGTTLYGGPFSGSFSGAVLPSLEEAYAHG